MRGCDGCTVCCEILEIKAIDKPAHEPCQYCDKGCTIYRERPEVCARFECAWLAGNWRDELRPDRCGVMIYHDADKGYQALMFVDPDQVNPLVMEQIDFLKIRYAVDVNGIDARNSHG